MAQVDGTLRTPTQERARALLTYEAEDGDDLAFTKGDVITILEKTEIDWWEGELNGRVGYFPSNYVKILERAQALRTYKAEEMDELSFREGDVITILDKEREDSGWCKGELNGQTGFFLQNCVKILPPAEEPPPVSTSKPAVPDVDLPGPTTPAADSKLKQEHARALFTFMAEKEDELSFTQGDVITILTRDGDPNWWKGELNGKVGYFPSNHVRIPTRSEARAQFTYVAEKEDELSFTEGDVITILGDKNKNWVKSELNGKVGYVPSNYVRILPREECSQEKFSSEHKCGP